MEFDQNIKAVILDLDGTIFHLDIDWHKLKREAQSLVGKSNISYDDTLKLAQQPQNEEVAKLIEKAEVEGATKGFESDGAAEAILEIKKAYKIAVVTRNARAAAIAVLEKLNIKDIIIIGREDVVNLKPHPEAIELALKHLKVLPENAIMVGDTFHDIHSAHRIGMRCVVVDNQNNRYKPEGGDRYVKNLLELSNLLIKDKLWQT